MKRSYASELIGCAAVALEHIEVVREPVYQGPRLLVVGDRQGRGGRDPKIRKKVRERRAREREAFEQLSRYYSLEDGEDGEYEAVWDRLSLLKEGKLEYDHSQHKRHPTYLHSYSAGGL